MVESFFIVSCFASLSALSTMYQNALANGSWGAPIPENPAYQQRSGSEQESQGDDGSSGSDYDEFDSDEDEEDEEYAPLQMGAWGTQPTGSEADANAIQMPDWNARPTDTTPSLTFKADDWKKLCDPNVVIKAGIGSGNLHRKGANYIPVTEQQILNQRLKLGAPMPSGKKKSRGRGKKSKGNPNAPKAPKAPKAHYPPPPPSAPRLKAPSRPVPTNSAWGQQLSSTPFWEQGGAKSSKYAPATPPPPPPAQQPQQQQQQQQRVPPARSAPPQSPASKWATQPLQETFTPPPPQQKQPQQAPPPPKVFGSSQSKYATSQPIPPTQPTQSTQPAQPAQPAQPVRPQPAQPAQPAAPVTPSYHGTISLTDQSPPTPPPRTTIFQLNIELIPGVTALLPVYETDDYTVLVKEFGAKHHLTIAPQAEFSFAEKIKQMVAGLRKQQQEAQQQEAQ
jgi:hypothetical protein